MDSKSFFLGLSAWTGRGLEHHTDTLISHRKQRWREGRNVRGRLERQLHLCYLRIKQNGYPKLSWWRVSSYDSGWHLLCRTQCRWRHKGCRVRWSKILFRVGYRSSPQGYNVSRTLTIDLQLPIWVFESIHG